MNEEIPFTIDTGVAYGIVHIRTESKVPEEMEPDAIDAAIRALKLHKEQWYQAERLADY